MRNLMLACAALAVISAIVSVNLWRELGAERAQTAQLRADLAAAVSRVSAQALPVQAAPPEVTAPLATTPAPAAATPAAAAPAAVQPVVAQAMNRQQELMKDPEYRAAALAQAMANLPRMYPDLAEELGLSTEEHEKLMRVLAEHQLEQRNVILPSVIGQADQAAAASEFAKRAQENQQRQDDAVVALLGAGKAQQFREYRETQGSRMQAAEFGRELQATGMPLSSVQQRALTGAFISEQRNRQQETRTLSQQVTPAAMAADPSLRARLMEQSMEMQAESNRRVLEAAKAHLTAAQFDSIQKRMESQAVMNRASNRLMQREMQAGQGQSANLTVIVP